MTKSDIFKDKFPGFKGVVDFYTTDGEQINFIDVDGDMVEFTVAVDLYCGCCYDYESREERLGYVMDYMLEGEFEELCSEVAKHV